ncbi:MAG: hypothetical protein NUV93_03770 [Firmicutes bacterium]|nr:hypothetical protein [Bacillota bacterium]
MTVVEALEAGTRWVAPAFPVEAPLLCLQRDGGSPALEVPPGCTGAALLVDVTSDRVSTRWAYAGWTRTICASVGDARPVRVTVVAMPRWRAFITVAGGRFAGTLAPSESWGDRVSWGDGMGHGRSGTELVLRVVNVGPVRAVTVPGLHR